MQMEGRLTWADDIHADNVKSWANERWGIWFVNERRWYLTWTDNINRGERKIWECPTEAAADSYIISMTETAPQPKPRLIAKRIS